MTEKNGENLRDLKQQIADAVHDIKQAKLDRADVNADIQAIRERMASKGIPKAALDMAMRYMEWDEDKREGFDVAYALVREACGAPLQEDLFQAADRMANDPKPEQEKPEQKGPDAAEIDKVIRAQDAEKIAGKTVHEPTGEHKGTIN